MITVERMLSNAATASQANQLLEPSTRGAILRSIGQWLNHNQDKTPRELMDILKEHEDYDL